MYYRIYESPCMGKIIIVGNKLSISELRLYSNEEMDVLISKGYTETSEGFESIIAQLNQYFNGERVEFDIDIITNGTDFQNQVWNALKDIPYGETRSYKDIAISIGKDKASRAVGMANNKNKIAIVIPCHRVIGSSGKLVGYAGGLDKKVKLLNLELFNLVFNKLLCAYGRQNWWPSDSIYEMMIGAILTQNTSWSNVEKAIENLQGSLIPEIIERMDVDKLAELIHPSGFYNQKAVKVKDLTEWYRVYDYKVMNTKDIDCETIRNELLSIKGIGRETADCILTYALNKPSFVIDAYTRRVFKRLGFPVPKNYDEFRKMFEDVLPKDLYRYGEYHALIVRHCKEHCISRPKCDGCPLERICKKDI